MIRNVQVEMNWLTLVRLVVITASLVTERRFVAPTGRLSFSMRLLDCIGNISLHPREDFFFCMVGGRVLDCLDTQDLILSDSTQESGISCIHLPLHSQEVNSFAARTAPRTFLEASFTKRVTVVFEQGSNLFVWPSVPSPRNWGRGDEVQSWSPIPRSFFVVAICSKLRRT